MLTLVRWTIALAAPVVVGCSGMEPSPMREVPFLRNRLAVGELDSCVVTDAQQLICWGRTPPTLVPVPEGPILSISAGTHTCLLANAGTAYCWGFNRYGQLGDGTIQSRTAPTAVATELRFAAIAAGAHSTCAITRLGELYCWGANDYGALGNGTAREGQTVLTPMPAKTTRRFDYVGGSGTYCAHATDQKVYCWGGVSGSFDDGVYKAPGDCTARYFRWYLGTQCLVPTPLDFGAELTRFGFDGGTDCAATSDGVAYCWGDGWLGTLGNGTFGSGVHAVTPVAVSGGLHFTALSSGGATVCGLEQGGKAYCWGNNFGGQLGDSSDISNGGRGRADPGPVVGNHAFGEISAGTGHGCGLTASGEVWCWGAGSEGQLGRDRALGNSSFPVRVILP